MGLRVYWTEFAKNELIKIFVYHNEKVSLNIARQITAQIVEKADELSIFIEMGAMEELLSDRLQEFRYLVSTNYKIIYWVNKDKNRIEIIDVFDTRQNPVKMGRNK
jgi:plasmid stabilization system protein ParE